MSRVFLDAKCQTVTTGEKFGICDDPPPFQNPAYLDTDDGRKWIAVVINEEKKEVTFTAIDHCIELKDDRARMLSRCDGALTFDSTVIFVELKERDSKGVGWIKDAEKQLRSTIYHFEKNDESDDYKAKVAYIANSQKPKSRDSQRDRMSKFFEDTGYVLRIERRINL